MKVTYNPEVDVLRILFRDAPIEESDEDTWLARNGAAPVDPSDLGPLLRAIT